MARVHFIVRRRKASYFCNEKSFCDDGIKRIEVASILFQRCWSQWTKILSLSSSSSHCRIIYVPRTPGGCFVVAASSFSVIDYTRTSVCIDTVELVVILHCRENAELLHNNCRRSRGRDALTTMVSFRVFIFTLYTFETLEEKTRWHECHFRYIKDICWRNRSKYYFIPSRAVIREKR